MRGKKRRSSAALQDATANVRGITPTFWSVAVFSPFRAEPHPITALFFRDELVDSPRCVDQACSEENAKNGSVLVGDVRGRYKFGDQDRIKIQTPFATTVYLVEISGDEMVLQEPGGTKLEFTRLKETRR
jgi:hypothetical protein